jgi:predicted aspartyl protease/tetratricopeptide (TPR) repeat protein
MRFSRLATSALAAAWLMFIARGAPAEASCQLQMIGELPVTMEGNEPLVELSINGRPVRFTLDTGAALTLLTRAGAEALDLHLIQLQGVTFYGAGGTDGASRARVRELKLGATVLHDFDMVVTGRIGANRSVGLLGRDALLSHNDLELDLAHHVVRLMKPKDCQGDQVVYWANSYSQASITSDRWNTINVNASLNGKRVSALLDTGANYSTVTLDAAHAAGVTPQSRGVVNAGGASGMGGIVQTWGGTFQTLAVGSETVQNAQLQLADLFSKDKEVHTGSFIAKDTVDQPDMVLGADFVKAHRIYIALSQGKLYFTYNGGRIFELPAAQAADDARAAIDSQPSTVDEHLRRGRALMNTARYAEALAEFDAAIALDAKSQRAWSERAIAHAWLVDPAAATDADRADTLGAPDIMAARARGLLAANTGDVAGARAAFRQALTLSPNDAFSLRHLFRLDLEAGDADAAARDLELLKQTQPPKSLELQLDHIVLQHRQARDAEARRALDALQAELRSPDELNSVCYNLAVEGIYLERALGDCDASLKSRPGDAATLDSRGFALMRLGRNAEALEAYNAALAAQPKEFNSLYGRGLVEARLGRADDSARDIRAALAGRPYLRQAFDDMGVK